MVERVISVCFIVGTLCIAGFGACYWIDAQPWKLGATMGGGLLFLGIGIVAWGKYLMPRGPFVEERHTLANSEADRQAFAAAIVERGGGVVQRRKLLGGLDLLREVLAMAPRAIVWGGNYFADVLPQRHAGSSGIRRSA